MLNPQIHSVECPTRAPATSRFRKFALHRSKAHLRRGVAIIEFAMVLPVLLILLVGTWEVGRMIEVQQTLNNAVREGARQASTGQFTNNEVEQIVRSYVSGASLPINNIVVTVQNESSPGTDVSIAVRMDRLRVRAGLRFGDVRWTTTRLIVDPARQLTAESVWNNTRPQGYPDDVSAPPGF